MIYWEEESLNDREKIFEFLYDFNKAAAEKTDELIKKSRKLTSSTLSECSARRNKRPIVNYS